MLLKISFRSLKHFTNYRKAVDDCADIYLAGAEPAYLDLWRDKLDRLKSMAFGVQHRAVNSTGPKYSPKRDSVVEYLRLHPGKRCYTNQRLLDAINNDNDFESVSMQTIKAARKIIPKEKG